MRNIEIVFVVLLFCIICQSQRQEKNACWTSGCSHFCEVSTNGATRCFCPDYLSLNTDKKRCLRNQNQTFLLVANGHSIKDVYFKRDGSLHVENITSGNETIADLSYDWTSDTLFFTYSEKDKIYAMKNSSTNKRVETFLVSEKTFECITFDEYTRNLFWLDKHAGTVNVATSDGKYTAVAITKVDFAVSFVLNTERNLVYVAIHGPNPRIVQASFFGWSRPMANGNNGPVDGLFLSISEQRLYYVGKYSRTIWSHGLSRSLKLRTTIEGTVDTDVYSMVKYNGRFFWTNRISNYLFTAREVNSVLQQQSMPLSSTSATRIVLVTPPGNTTNSCSVNNGGCSHICLPGLCVCPPGSTLMSNGKTCEMIQPCHEFKCADGMGCVGYIFVCDGHKDCDDGSDENNCAYNCQEHEYRCKNGHCIHQSFWCDGAVDCTDGSDEINCTNVTCHSGQFDCGNGECVLASSYCDKKHDCSNGNDEKDCRFCKNDASSWQCRAGECIPRLWLCDETNDCEDGSDEEKCHPACNHLCEKGHCIHEWQVCDGVQDCPDRSDEVACSAMVTTTSAPLSTSTMAEAARSEMPADGSNSTLIIILVIFFVVAAVIVIAAVFRNVNIGQCIVLIKCRSASTETELRPK